MRRYLLCECDRELNLQDSESLARMAKEVPEWNALWTRGIFRRDLMEAMAEENNSVKEESSWKVEGPDEELSAAIGEGLHIFTDASGGKHTSNQ